MTGRKIHKLSNQVENNLIKESESFSKWVGDRMTLDEFVEYLLILFNEQKTRHRIRWQIVSINPQFITMVDRKLGKKIIIERIKKKLYCTYDKNESCDHCKFALNDKKVKESLNEEYVWNLTHPFSKKFLGKIFVDYEVEDHEAEKYDKEIL